MTTGKIWKDADPQLMPWIRQLDSIQGSLNPALQSALTRSLPRVNFAHYDQQRQQIRRASREWTQEPFLDLYHGTKTDGEPVEINCINRQRVMAFLKMHQNAGTPRILPFLGSENFFFGTLRCRAGKIKMAMDLYLLLDDLDAPSGLQHRLTSTREFLRGMDKHRWTPADFLADKTFRFFPVVNLQIDIGSQRISLLAYVTYDFDDGTLQLACHAAAFAVIRTIGVEGTSRQPSLLRWAGILDHSLYPSGTASAPNIQGSLSSCAYITDVCTECAFYAPRRLRDLRHRPYLGNTSGGSMWCLHYKHKRYGDWLLNQMDWICKISGSPPRFSVSAGKWYFRKKRKMYRALVELGSSLQGSGNFWSLSEYNRGSGGRPLIDFVNGPDLSNATFDIDLLSPTCPLLQTGKAVGSPENLKLNISFATATCVHMFPDSWDRTQFTTFPKYVDEKDPYEDVRSCTTFLPPSARIVETTQEILDAASKKLIPVILANRYAAIYSVGAAVQSIGGYCYEMRECIHCAVIRVQKLSESAGLVVILTGMENFRSI